MPLLRVQTVPVGADTAVLGEVQLHAVVVPLASEKQEGEGGAGHEQEVKGAEEDEALGDADDVAAVRNGEGDRVQEPEEVDPADEHGVVAADLDAVGGGAADPHGLEGEEEVGDGAEGVEAPLIAGGRVSGAEI